MKEFNSVDDILDFAIINEQQAVDFYNNLALRSNNDDMKQTFQKFAIEEVNHKAKLTKIKEEKTFTLGMEKIQDLHLSDYIDNVKPSENMSYADALILAMKREKSAFKLYNSLANRTDNADLKQLFLQLAQEESKHKMMFEIEYDEVILKEN